MPKTSSKPWTWTFVGAILTVKMESWLSPSSTWRSGRTGYLSGARLERDSRMPAGAGPVLSSFLAYNSAGITGPTSG